MLYAKLEEDYGLARHAMAVYDRATKAVTPEQQFEVIITLVILTVQIKINDGLT